MYGDNLLGNGDNLESRHNLIVDGDTMFGNDDNLLGSGHILIGDHDTMLAVEW